MKRPNINDGDRTSRITVMRMLREWRSALVFIQPDRVVQSMPPATWRAARRRTTLVTHEQLGGARDVSPGEITIATLAQGNLGALVQEEGIGSDA